MLKSLLFSIKELLTFQQQEKFFSNKLKSKKWLVLAILSVLLWQGVSYNNSNSYTDKYKREDAGGFAYHRAHHFLYFYYYLDLFPVLTSVDKEYSKAGAESILADQGASLQMEYGHWSRLGESARMWAFLPNAWLKGSPENPSIKLFNTLFFVAALISLLIGFWKIKRPFMGLLLVLMLGSSPFYLYETYVNENIFSLPTSVAFILLGLFLPVIFAKEKKPIGFLVVFSGLLIGFVCNVRAENLPIIASCAMVLMLDSHRSWLKKGLLTVLMCVTYYVTNKAIIGYFDAAFEEAYEIVENHGGNPYNGGKIESHRFWHPFFCGLGDFDEKYGYAWNDIVAYNYAIPILKEKYGLDLNYSGDKYYLDEYYDEKKMYYVKFDEIDEYEEVMKDKVLSDIKEDPVWYITILLKRVNRIFTHTSPIGIGISYFKLQSLGWLFVPLLLLLLRIKEWEYLKLLLFATPLFATSILIYSKGNSVYSSPYHFIWFMLLVSLILEYLMQRFTAKKRSKSLEA